MSKAPKAPTSSLTAVSKNAVAVPASPAHNWRRITTLANLADQIVETYDEIQKQRWQLAKRYELQPIEPYDATLGDWHIKDIRRCQQLFREVDKEEFYEDTDDEDDDRDVVLKESIVAKRLTLLLATVRSGAPKEAEPEGFNQILLAHVLDTGVGYLPFESACRQIESAERYVRIPDLLKALDEQSELWRHRRIAVRHIEEMAEDLQTQITKTEKRFRLDKVNDVARRAAADVETRMRWLRQMQKEADRERAEAEGMIERARQKVDKAQRHLDEGIAAMRIATAEREKVEAEFEAERQADAAATRRQRRYRRESKIQLGTHATLPTTSFGRVSRMSRTYLKIPDYCRSAINEE